MGILGYFKEKKRAKEAEEAAQREKWRQEEANKRARIESSPMVEALMHDFTQRDWAMRRQSAQDKGDRELRVTDDTVEIKWYDKDYKSEYVGVNNMGFAQYENKLYVDVHQHVVHSFTQNGYADLRYDWLGQRVLAEVLVERIAAAVPGTYYSEYKTLGSNTDVVYHYTLPAPTRTMF